MFRILVFAFVTFAMTAPAAVDLRLDGDRMWMKASDASLREVMEAFARLGVTVRFDTSVSGTCSGAISDAPLDAALTNLFSQLGYVFTYDLVRGPIGDYTRLAGIQVFRIGNPDAVTTLEAGGRMVVTRLPGHPPFVADEILIGFRPGTKMEQVRDMLAKTGGTIVSSIPRLGVYRIRLPAGANVLSVVDLLKKNDIVAAVEPNYVTQLPGGSATGDPALAALRKIGVPASGAASVAVLDSGQLSGSGYDAGVVGTFNAIHPGAPMSDPVGHGTQMSMIVAGSVSPGGVSGDSTAAVPVLAVRAFDDQGLTSNYALMDAINYAGSQGARVINLSWGSENNSDFVHASIAQAQQSGMIVVAAAGNEATGTAMYPSAYDGVVSVAALNADGTLWQNSNYGPTVTVAAPGTASFPVGHDGPPGSYAGTSIASAYVSHALAQYLAQNPTATSQQAVTALTSSVTDAGSPGKDPYYGYGSLDAAAMTRLLGTAK